MAKLGRCQINTRERGRTTTMWDHEPNVEQQMHTHTHTHTQNGTTASTRILVFSSITTSVPGLAPKYANMACSAVACSSLPKALALTYVQLDNRHWSASVNYSMGIGQIFSVFSKLHPVGLSVAMTQFRAATESYLRHEAYQLGC